MERRNGDYVYISDDEAPPKRRQLNPSAAKNPLGLTAIARDGSRTKARVNIPDGPIANPLDIFPYAEDFREPPALDNIMDGITHPNNTPDKIPTKEKKFKSCLTKVRELFPDVSQKHVRKLYDDHTKGSAAFPKPEDDSSQFDFSPLIIEQLLDDGTYPKEKKKNRKRKRNSDSSKEANAPVQPKFDALKTASYITSARKILETEFPKVPSTYVRLLLHRNIPLYQVYATLEASERTYTATQNPAYRQLKKERKLVTDPELFNLLPSTGAERNQLANELSFAQEKRRKEDDVRRQEKEFAEMEAQNEKRQAEIGAIVECQCCYVDVPLNRTIHCENNDGHFFCYDCMKNGAKSQIGLMRFEMRCFDTSGCQSGYSRSLLRKALGEVLMDKLDTIQQRQEIEAAGIEGLHECPFCDFRAICPPVEEDREFRCFNPECEKVSCRLCNKPSHVPMTCGEARQDEHLSTRHQIEEAMSEALMRSCPKCKVKIIKENGCNKMQCTKCRTLMCYVCKKDITGQGYSHFNQGRYGPSEPGKCSVYDKEGLDRHKDEVERAEKEAFKKAKEENPGLSKKDVGVERRARRGRSDAAGHGPNHRGVMGDFEGAQDLLLLANHNNHHHHHHHNYQPYQPYQPLRDQVGGVQEWADMMAHPFARPALPPHPAPLLPPQPHPQHIIYPQPMGARPVVQAVPGPPGGMPWPGAYQAQERPRPG